MKIPSVWLGVGMDLVNMPAVWQALDGIGCPGIKINNNFPTDNELLCEIL